MTDPAGPAPEARAMDLAEAIKRLRRYEYASPWNKRLADAIEAEVARREQAEADLGQCRQILAADMTLSDGGCALPRPSIALTPVASCLYQAIEELRSRRARLAALQSVLAGLEELRQRIEAWQTDDKGGYDQAIGLLCEVEDHLAALRTQP